MRLIIILEDLL